jgi:hypothetical protein
LLAGEIMGSKNIIQDYDLAELLTFLSDIFIANDLIENINNKDNVYRFIGLECVLNHANHMTVDTRSSIEK